METKEQKEINRLKKEIKKLEEQLTIKQQKINTRDRNINNLKMSQEDTMIKVVKSFDDLIEIRTNKKAKTKKLSDVYDLTDYSTIIIQDDKRLLRVNVGNRKMRSFRYVKQKDGIYSLEETLIEPELNIYIDWDYINKKKPTDWTKKVDNINTQNYEKTEE